MDGEEWWWIYDVRRPRDRATDYAGRLTESDVKELYEMLGD